jgi:hypothetical protein
MRVVTIMMAVLLAACQPNSLASCSSGDSHCSPKEYTQLCKNGESWACADVNERKNQISKESIEEICEGVSNEACNTYRKTT